MINIDDAVKIFLNILIRHVYQGSLNSVKNLLEKGPPGKVKKMEDVKIQEWYQKLDGEEKRIVINVIRNTVIRTIFNFLVLLDNKIGYPLGGEVSDFSINLQTYKSQKELFGYEPREVIRVNRSYSNNDDLHDEFLNLLEQGKNNNKDEKS